AAATVSEQPEPAGRQPVLQLSDSNFVPGSVAESETGFSGLASGTVSAIRRLVPDRCPRRGGAVSLCGVKGAESLQQRVQLPGFVRIHSREDPDQRLRERQHL